MKSEPNSDLAVYIEGKHLKHLERTMHLCINQIQKWFSENGFKFSISKTTCVNFHMQRIYSRGWPGQNNTYKWFKDTRKLPKNSRNIPTSVKRLNVLEK